MKPVIKAHLFTIAETATVPLRNLRMWGRRRRSNYDKRLAKNIQWEVRRIMTACPNCEVGPTAHFAGSSFNSTVPCNEHKQLVST